jgi:hypothetical protein
VLASLVHLDYHRYMNNLYTAAIAASILALAAPAAAFTTQNPIEVQSVFGSQGYETTPGVVSIAFQNTADSAAREVTFVVNDAGGHSTQVEDVGTFAKGVTIRHEFHISKVTDGVRASVVHVELADGSSWDAPLAPQSLRQAAAIPAIPTFTTAL